MYVPRMMVLVAASDHAPARLPAQLAWPPSCCVRCAVSVDGVTARTYVPRAQDPAGWFTAAADAPPDAPFDQPFYLIL